MAEAENGVTKVTLFVSIGVALLIGFLAGIIYSDRSSPPSAPIAQQQSMPPIPQQQAQLGQEITSLQLAVQQNPNNAEAWTQLGNAYFDSNQPAKSIEAYNKSLQLIPGNPSILTDLGVMYRRNGQPDKALETFNKALAIAPNFEQALFNKGVVLYNDKGDIKGARDVWNQLLAINPNARGTNGVAVSEMVKNLSKQLGDK